MASRKASNDPSYSMARSTMAVSPAAGSLTLSWERLKNGTTEAADDPSDDAGEKRRTGGERDT
ncbi:MAG: hypothetical protein M3255_10195 [Pseudomonadota bacterium]|nr:hypothetical protein [Pseudomonadota bacterium]